MAKDKTPVTPAIRLLRQHKINFTPCLYAYEERGGTAVSARELGVAEHAVIKTLVMEDEQKEPLIVLMHGDKEVSTKQLARELNCKMIQPCTPEVANRHSGYQVGGTSPFATRKVIKICLEASILELDKIYINGGKRGFLVEVAPADVVKLLQPVLVHAGI
jgi:Cys-tRNA(Pro) deacylase